MNLLIFNKFTTLIFLFIIKISISTIQDGDKIIEVFGGDKQYIHGQIAINSKGDMIIEYSANDSYRIFYGIKQNGKGFFDGNYVKEINLGDYKLRYESINIFIYLNSSVDDNTQYLLSVSAYECHTELYNIENDISQSQNYITKLTTDVLGNQILSFKNSLLELKSDQNVFNNIYQ